MPDPQDHRPPTAMVSVPPSFRAGRDTQPLVIPDEAAARSACDAWMIAPRGVLDTVGVIRLPQQVSDALTAGTSDGDAR